MRELQPTVGCRMTEVLLEGVQLLTLPPVRRRVKMAVQRLEEEELGAVVEERFWFSRGQQRCCSSCSRPRPHRGWWWYGG